MALYCIWYFTILCLMSGSSRARPLFFSSRASIGIGLAKLPKNLTLNTSAHACAARLAHAQSLSCRWVVKMACSAARSSARWIATAALSSGHRRACSSLLSSAGEARRSLSTLSGRRVWTAVTLRGTTGDRETEAWASNTHRANSELNTCGYKSDLTYNDRWQDDVAIKRSLVT